MPDVPRSYVIPSWADPQQASVTDSNLTKALRWIGSVIGADSPTAQALATLTPMDTGEGGGVIGAVQRFIKAYHGSPYDFSQFSSSQIGTGEGAQLYGHGLYFAENPKTAGTYRVPGTSVPAGWGAVGTAVGTASPKAGVPVLANPTGEIPSPVLDELKAVNYLGFDTAGQALTAMRQDPQWKQTWDIRSGDRTTAIEQYLQRYPGGRMYEVAIKSDPEHFLDWDQPLSEQSPTVQKAVTDLVQPGRLNLDRPDVWNYARGSDLYRALSQQFGSREAAATKLAEQGVPGIKYFDQGLRASGEGTRNFVVFDDKTIDILRKYGVLLPAAGVGAAASQTQGAQP